MSTRKTIKRGFTLIEILIVVVILGILAAIVIPQFTNAADEAATSQAKTQLQSMRSQVQLFRAKYGVLPGDAGDDGTLDGAGAVWADLMSTTDPNGATITPFIPAIPTLGGDYDWSVNGGRLIVLDETGGSDMGW